MVLTFGCAAITEQLGIHAVFGAFVAGVLVAESPRVREATLDALDSVITGVFAPIFFVYTGLRVTSLALPPVSISVLIIGGAIVGKVIGAGLGAKFGGMRLAPALAVGIGMSSRGSMELVVARIGLDLRVLSQTIYATIVLVPIVTSFTTPLLLRLAAGAVKPEPDEASRLDREAEDEKAVIKRTGTKILVGLSGGPRSYQAMRFAAPVARLPGATMVVVSVVPEDDASRRTSLLQRRAVLTKEESQHAFETFAAEERLPDCHPQLIVSPSPVESIREELRRGYDLVFLGAGRRRMVANRILTAVLEQGRADAVVLSGESFLGHSIASSSRPRGASPPAAPRSWRCSMPRRWERRSTCFTLSRHWPSRTLCKRTCGPSARASSPDWPRLASSTVCASSRTSRFRAPPEGPFSRRLRKIRRISSCSAPSRVCSDAECFSGIPSNSCSITRRARWPSSFRPRGARAQHERVTVARMAVRV